MRATSFGFKLLMAAAIWSIAVACANWAPGAIVMQDAADNQKIARLASHAYYGSGGIEGSGANAVFIYCYKSAAMDQEYGSGSYAPEMAGDWNIDATYSGLATQGATGYVLAKQTNNGSDGANVEWFDPIP